LTAMKASTSVLNLMRAITGRQWRSRKRGVTWENFGKLNTSCAAAFWNALYGFDCGGRESSQERVAVVEVSHDELLDQDLC